DVAGPGVGVTANHRAEGPVQLDPAHEIAVGHAIAVGTDVETDPVILDVVAVGDDAEAGLDFDAPALVASDDVTVPQIDFAADDVAGRPQPDAVAPVFADPVALDHRVMRAAKDPDPVSFEVGDRQPLHGDVGGGDVQPRVGAAAIEKDRGEGVVA